MIFHEERVMQRLWAIVLVVCIEVYKADHTIVNDTGTMVWYLVVCV